MKLFKKVLLMVLCLLMLSGCGNASQTPDVSEIADRLKGYSPETISWTQLKKDDVPAYFGFGKEVLADFTGYISTSEEYFDIIAVFKLEEQQAREDVIKGVSLLVNASESNYKMVSDAQHSKILNKIIAEKDDIIILCVVDNYSLISKYLEEDLGAEILP